MLTLIFLGIAVAATWGGVHYANKKAVSQLRSAAGVELASLASSLVSFLDREMFERLEAIKQLSTRPEFTDARASATARRAVLESRRDSNPNYTWLGFVDLEGRILVGSGGLLEGKSAAGRTWFVEGQKGPFSGDVHAAVLLEPILPREQDGIPLRMVDVSAPVRNTGGEVSGVVGAHMDWRWAHRAAARLLSSKPRGLGMEILVVDQAGMIISGPPAQMFQKISVPSLLAAQARQRSNPGVPLPDLEAFSTEPWPDGRTFMVGFAPSLGHLGFAGLGWTVLVREPLESVLAPAADIQREILFTGLLAGLVLAMVGWWFAGWIARPLEEIARGAGMVADGTVLLPLPVSTRYVEIFGLSRALNGLLDKLQAKQTALEEMGRSLEEQVRARTAELTATNERLQETMNELHFQKFALDAHAIVSASDVKGNITYVNDQFCRISGFAPEELLGRNHRIVKSDEHPPELYRDLWRTIARGHVWHGQVRNRTKSGGHYWVNATIVPFLNERGKPFKYISIRTDITRNKELEAELAVALKEAEAATRAKSSFLSNMSHEIRTPMNAIIGLTDLCLRTEIPPRQRDYLNKIYASANSLLRIINDILDFSKIEAGKLDIEFIPFQLDDVLDNLWNLVAVPTREKGLEVLFSLAPDVPRGLVGDPLRLGQI
ncbi:MAG: histidine kinase dimerization/phospho-acceptor domain-containing protein, partial [Alphaproteobacteria bacterium]